MEAPAVDAEITTLQVFSDESDKQSLYLSFPLFLVLTFTWHSHHTVQVLVMYKGCSAA